MPLTHFDSHCDAKEYGIPEYVELIKAVMMQESGGRGLDPMQAAEGSFHCTEHQEQKYFHVGHTL